MTNATLTMWFEITSRGTSGDQVMDILYSWRADREQLMRRIAELEAATRPIPATEQLPDDNVRVIVFDTTLERVGIARHVAQVPQWATDDGVFYHNDSYGWITHWQPLPQPPEVQDCPR